MSENNPQNVKSVMLNLDDSNLSEAAKNLLLRVRRSKLMKECNSENSSSCDNSSTSTDVNAGNILSKNNHSEINNTTEGSSKILTKAQYTELPSTSDSDDVIMNNYSDKDLYPDSDKLQERNSSNFDKPKKDDCLLDSSISSKVKDNDTVSNNGIGERNFITSCGTSNVASAEPELNLNEMLDLSGEEDLLCKISMKEDETFSDNESDESPLSFEFSANLQESDLQQMICNDPTLFEKVPALQIGAAVPDLVLSIEEANFSKSVSQVLKAIKFQGPSCIQSVVWPAVERGRDVLVVAPPHSGKTVSYVLPLVSRFTSRDVQTTENRGPHSIILCSTWRKIQAVNDCFKLFLGGVNKKIFKLFTNGGHFQNKLKFLIGECDVLIATPHCLLEFLEKKLISLSRLEEFVVDDGSAVMKRHKTELKEIFLCILEAIKSRRCSPQFVLCTERWNTNFQVIVDKIMKNPLIYFTSFLEAAIYGRITMKAFVCDSVQMKKITLFGIVKQSPKKFAICTINASEASEVHQFLLKQHCSSYMINEEMEHFIKDDVFKSWKLANCETASHCLIVTDQVLAGLQISKADCLINFDIPPKSRLQFGNRFSTIAEHFTEQKSSLNCLCHILILKSEQHLADGLVKILENSGNTPSEKLVELSRMQNKDEKHSGELCHFIKAYGVCTRSHCENRHSIIPDLDKPQIVPYEGDIHAIVTHIIDASHYYVRLIKYLNPESSETVSLVGAYASIGFKLRNYYSHVSEEMKVEPPVIGESYVIEEDNKLYYRVKVLGFIPETACRTAQWRVLYLDEGWIKYKNPLKLYNLTDQFDLAPLAVEVYACNIAPPDSSFDWNPQTCHLVSDLIKGKEIHGKIVLCIGKTLWLDPLALTVKLADGHYVYPFRIDQKLLDYGHVIKRKSHLELLYKACRGKINYPHISKPTLKDEKFLVEPETTINYAFLDCNVLENVYVSCVVSPDQIYVQRAKFVSCLDELLEKINSFVHERKLKRAYSIFKDMVCIAPFFEDNRYYRAIVTSILPEDKVQVFYVDFGDTGTVLKKDIYSITSEFLLLPFQAIECKLAGISPVSNSWPESAGSTLNTLTRDDAHDMKIVQLKAYSKTSSYSCGNRYLIDLWDDGKKLSEELINAGYCVSIELPPDAFSKETSAESSDLASDLNEESSPASSEVEDSDLDPEDKDIAANFYGVVAKMLAEEYDLFPLPKDPRAEESEDEEEILKSINLNSLPASEKKCDNHKIVFPKLNQLQKLFPSSKLPSNSLRPQITWWDTVEELNILINLKDIKVYELDITHTGLTFNTIIAGVQYSTEETFYDKIISNESKSSQTFQGISIVSKKCTPFKWPRLTKEKKKFFHIKYDLVHIEDSDNEDNPKRESKVKGEARYQYDEEDSTTDDDETYVEPWSEFAQNKNPVNDLFKEF